MKQPWGKEKFRTPTIVRSIFILSSLIVIAAAVLSVFEWGFNDLKTASADGLELVEKFTNIAQQGNGIVTNMKKPVGEYAALRDIIINELRSEVFCAGDPGEAVNESRNGLVQSLYALEDFSTEGVSTLRTDIFGNMESLGGVAEYYFGIFGVKDWEVWMYLISFCAISSFFIFGTILAAAGKPFNTLACFNTWFLLPVFLVVVTLAWTIVSFYGVGAVMNSDYCSGGDALGNPDTTTQQILNITQGGIEKTVYAYWLAGDCDSAIFPLSFVPDFVSKLRNTTISIESLESAMSATTNLPTICGGKDFVPILDYLDRVTSDYLELSKNMTLVQNLLSCENIHPIYVDLVHGVTCTDVPEAAVWAFGSLLIIAFFSLVMITCRTAWLVTIRQDGLSSFTEERPSMGESKLQSNHSSNFDDSPRRPYNHEEYDDDDYNLTQDLENVRVPDGHELDDLIDDDGIMKHNSLVAQDDGHKFVPVTRSSPSWVKGTEEINDNDGNGGEEEDVAKDDWENGGRWFRRGKPTKKAKDFPLHHEKVEDEVNWL